MGNKSAELYDSMFEEFQSNHVDPPTLSSSGLINESMNHASDFTSENIDYGQDITNYDSLDSDYDWYNAIDTYEDRAQNQSAGEKTMKGLARLGFKTAMNIAEMPGIVYGALEAAATGDPYALINNGWSNAIQSANEWFDEEAMPIYMKRAVKDGDLWDNIKSVDFWATEGADGLAFALSALVPGAALKAGKVGVKAAHLLGKLKGGKYLEKADELIKATGITNTASGIDVAGATALNTIYEAGIEAKSGMDSYKKQIDTMLEEGDINEKQYADLEGKLGEVGAKIFGTNAALLLIPNAIMSKSLFGKALPKKQLGKFSRVDGKYIDDLANVGMRQTLLNNIGSLGKTVATSTASEGLLEEAGQMTAEKQFTEGTIADYLGEERESVFETYMNVLGSTEGQKAIMLGGLFGTGMSKVGDIRGHKANMERRAKLGDMMSVGANLMDASISGVYAKDEEGNVVFEDGKPKIDNTKLAKLGEELTFAQSILDEKEFTNTLVEEYGMSEVKAAARNKMLDETMRRQGLMSFVYAGEEGMQVLENYLENGSGIEAVVAQKHKDNKNVDLKSETKKEIGAIMAEAKSLQTDLDYAQNYIHYKNKLHNKMKNKYYGEYMAKLHQDYTVASSSSRVVGEKITELQAKVDEIKNNGDAKDSGILLDNIKTELDTYVAIKKTVDKNLESMLDATKQATKFDKFVKKQEKLEKADEEIKKLDDTINEFENAENREELDDLIAKNAEDESHKQQVQDLVTQEIQKIEDLGSNATEQDYTNAINKVKKLNTFNSEELDLVVEALEELQFNNAVAIEEFKKELTTLSKETKEKSKIYKDKLREVQTSLRSAYKQRAQIKKDLNAADASPRGRNAKILKELYAETEANLKALNEYIAYLESEKKQTQLKLDEINTQISNLDIRNATAERNNFKSVQDIIKHLNNQKKLQKDHRYELLRLETNKFYTEQELEALNSLIVKLNSYYDVLQSTLKEHQKTTKEDIGNANIDFIVKEMENTYNALQDANASIQTLQPILKRLDKAILSKKIIEGISKEIKFLEDSSVPVVPTLVNNTPKLKPVLEAARKKKEAEFEARRQKEIEEVKKKTVTIKESSNKEVNNHNKILNYILEQLNVHEHIPMEFMKHLQQNLGTATEFMLKSKNEDGSITITDNTFGEFEVHPLTTPTDVGTTEIVETEGTEVSSVKINTEVNDKNAVEFEEEITKSSKVASNGYGTSEEFTNAFLLNRQNKVGMGISLSIMNPGASDPKNPNVEVELLKDNSRLAIGVYNKIIKGEQITNAEADIFKFFFPISINIDGTNHKSNIFAVNNHNRHTPEFKIRENILTALLENPGSTIADIKTTITYQGKGELTMAPKGTRHSVNMLEEVVNNGIDSVEFAVIGDTGVLIDPITKEPVEGMTVINEEWKGAVFMMLPRETTGELFPLHVNINRISEAHASGLYDLLHLVASNPAINDNISLDAIPEGHLVSFKEEIELLTKVEKVSKADLTVNDLMRFMYFTGSTSGKSRLTLSKNEILFGENVLDATSGEDMKEEFVYWVSQNKNRNVQIKYLNNAEYKEYLANENVLYTNADVTKPLFNKNSDIFVDSNVQVTKKQGGTKTVAQDKQSKKTDLFKKQQTSNIESKKVDIERRREEDLNNPIKIDNYISPQPSPKEALIKFRDYLIEAFAWDKMPIGYSSNNLTLDYLGKELKIPAKLTQIGGGSTLLEIDIKDVINAKYDAELAALEPKQQTSNIESKKVDIERRREEELDNLISEKEFIKSIFPDTEINQVVYHATNKKFSEFKVGKYSSSIFFAPTKEEAWTQKGDIIVEAIINSKNPLIVKNDKFPENNEGNYDSYITEYTKEYINSLPEEHLLGGEYFQEISVDNPNQTYILTEEEKAKIYNKDNVDKINAKYDAELTALEPKQQTSEVEVKETEIKALKTQKKVVSLQDKTKVKKKRAAKGAKFASTASLFAKPTSATVTPTPMDNLTSKNEEIEEDCGQDGNGYDPSLKGKGTSSTKKVKFDI